MTLDFPSLSPWLHLAELAVILMLWLRKPGEEAGAKVAELKKEMDSRLGTITADVNVIKAHMEHMPTRDDLTRLAGNVQGLEVAVEAIKDKVKTTSDGVARIERFLLENK